MLVRAEQSGEMVAEQPRGGSQSGMRLYNERLVLGLIRHHGSLPKAEIARLTGLSAQTCSVIVKGLDGDGLLIREKPQRGRVGQPSVPFSLNPDGAYSIGLKIGRRSADALLMNFTGGVLERRRLTYPYPELGRVLEFAETSWEALEARLSTAARRRIVGMGVAMPGEIWNWAREVGAPLPVLAQWREADIGRLLADRCPWPVMLYNDATAACAAELTFGQGRHHRHFLYIFVGSFIGGGLVMDGRLFTGQSGHAGAIGPLPVPDGRGGVRQLIHCTSIFALENRCREAGHDPRELWLDEGAWSRFEPLVEDWLDEAAANIAIAIVAALSVIDLDTVMLDGAFPPSVRTRLRLKVEEAVERLDRQGLNPFVMTEGSIGDDARAMGGACLPILAHFATDSELFLKGAA
ncbi:MAG: ROK family transcriptional regulator [Geminicoccaceae bacterium]